MSGNQRHNNASTVNLSTKFIVWCRGKSVGSFDTNQAAKEFLKKCPLGSYIQYPMGAIRDHQIAKARKTETINPAIDVEAWDRFRAKQLETEKAERKTKARLEITKADSELTPDEIASRCFK